MGLTISTAKGVYDIPVDFSLEIENTSPVYTNKGSQTIPITIPGTRHNLEMVRYLHRLDIADAPVKDMSVLISDGMYIRTGRQNITSASVQGGIVTNIGFDESLMYNTWNNVKLKQIPDLPVFQHEDGIPGLMTHLSNVMKYQETADYLVFPIQVNNEVKDEKPYPEFINPIHNTGTQLNPKYELTTEARTIKTIISGELRDLKVPEGYGVSPFLRVSKIFDLIFSSYGFKLIENPFADHYQLKKMVVLNNVADACVKGEVKYADMLPDCTINEFLDSIFCRTGAKVYVDGNTKTARIIFLKDSLSAYPQADWTSYRTSELIPSYEEPKQLKISANTSFDNAEPASDSFDEFLSQFNGIITVVEDATPNHISPDSYMNYQSSTGKFIKRDIIDSKNTSLVSSDFFPWDKKAPNIAYEEITGKDECVPMDFAEGPILCPQYLAGSVHYNTTLRGMGDKTSKEDKKETPLSFCFAMGMAINELGIDSGYYFGSSLCRDPTGNYFKDPDGNTYNISLTFRGEDGAFNRFFKAWDAILRHANHILSGDMKLNRLQLSKMDVSIPVSVSGQPLMIENVKHSLPLSNNHPASVKLRTMRLLRPYDLDKEQELVQMQNQVAKWEFVNYFEEARLRRIAELMIIYNTPTTTFRYRGSKPVTEPSDDEFSSYLPPSYEDVLQGKEILNTYQLVVWYVIEYNSGNTTGNIEDYSEYKAGLKAVMRQ